MPTDVAALRDLLDHPGALVGAVLLVGLLARLLRRRKPRRRARAAASPQVGDVWFADVPFADGTGSKDRPVLVLHVGPSGCEVARFTSQDRSARRDHVRLPPGFPGLSRASWIDLRPRTLPLAALRRRSGRPGEALVAWYREAARDARAS